MKYSLASLIKAVHRARRVYLIGNGGSYANAMHIANDLAAAGIKAHVLDPATLTASANDYGYEGVFARWVNTHCERGDLLIALSGSGRSPNILAALAAARRKRIAHVLITDYLRSLDMQASEEAQLLIGHELWRALKSQKKN